MFSERYEHNGPITWMGRVPVYLATVLAAVQFVSMVVTALLLGVIKSGGTGSVGAAALYNALIFESGAVFAWELWRFVTYAFVNPPDFFFVFQLFFFAWFGSEVEKFLGRKGFAILCILLLLATPALLTALALLDIPSIYVGAGLINLAVFLSFCMIYPRAQIFWGLEARWLGLILAVVNSLILIAQSPWSHLAALWWGIAVAALWLRFEGVDNVRFPSVGDYFRRKHSERKLRAVPGAKKLPEAETVHDSIDPILEKIARQGIGSLSRSEREKLERARAALLEKERGH
jgi:Rhomboid family.